ncbi:hypothetical protein J4406_00575 [Candidatus Woesearchaeota archaeon]|nr:hypothetical protein [Candidatus Woesearchaeota archaeon]
MFCNKKGDWSSFRKIILLLLTAVILIPLTYLILNEGSRGAEIAACKNWAILQSVTTEIPLAPDLNNPCMTFQDEAKGIKDEIYETIANGMYDVWNMYGRGEVDFLSDTSFLGRFDSNVYCFIGDEISFDKDMEIDVNDFEYYLSHTYPEKSESTYSEFFMKAENSDIDFGDGTIEITSSEKLYIIYAVEKKARSDWTGVVENFATSAFASFIGITSIKSIVPGAKSISNKKVFTGTFKQSRDSLGRFAKQSTLTKTRIGIGKPGSVGLIIGTLGTIAGVTSDQSVMIPSLLVMQGDEIIKAGCEQGIHYNPKAEKDKLKFKNE